MASYSPVGSSMPLSGISGNAPINVVVGNVSTEVIPANPDITLIYIANIGVKDVYLSPGNPGEASKGLVILKGDTKFLPVPGLITETINGITSAGTTTLAIQVWE